MRTNEYCFYPVATKEFHQNRPKSPFVIKMRNHTVNKTAFNLLQRTSTSALSYLVDTTNTQFQSIVFIRLYDDARQSKKYKRIKMGTQE